MGDHVSLYGKSKFNPLKSLEANHDSGLLANAISLLAQSLDLESASPFDP